jgi:hypothetical protein
MRSGIKLAVVIVCAALFAGSCWNPPSALSGLWVASSELSANYLELEQSGRQLDGVVCETLPNAPNVATFRQVPVRGSVSGHISISFFVTFDTGMTATFTGTLNGRVIRGEFVRKQDGYTRILEFRPSEQAVPMACR